MAKKIVLPPVYYEIRAGEFLLRLNEKRYLQLGSRDIKNHMKIAGMDVDYEQEGITLFDRFIHEVQSEHWVDFSGPIAGKKCGPMDVGGGKRILVTSEAVIVEPKRVAFPGIEAFMGQLFECDKNQLPFVLYWLKLSYESLVSGVFRPGHLLAMAGPSTCGKSFLHILITELLGGRMAKPFRYMTGKTTFNNDLAGSEHLMMEDESAHSNYTARREFGTQIKNWTTDEFMSVHPKGREAFTLSLFRRLSLSVNWEPENLYIMPVMDESIRGRIMLMKCGAVDEKGNTVPPALDTDREKNREMLKRELPGFVRYLLALKIPRNLREDRYGVVAYHNPELLEILADMSSEKRLEELIDEVIFGGKDSADSVNLRTSELEQQLRQSAFYGQVTSLLTHTSSCGTFLARLAKSKPERFSATKSKGYVKWLIKKGE